MSRQVTNNRQINCLAKTNNGISFVGAREKSCPEIANCNKPVLSGQKYLGQQTRYIWVKNGFMTTHRGPPSRRRRRIQECFKRSWVYLDGFLAQMLCLKRIKYVWFTLTTSSLVGDHLVDIVDVDADVLKVYHGFFLKSCRCRHRLGT